MARTISTSPPSTGMTDDLDGQVVDGIEALRQRILQAIRFRAGTWFLSRRGGLDYGLLIGHQIPPALAASAVNRAILEEGGDEIISLEDVEYSLNRADRVFSYSVRVMTTHGPMQLNTGLTLSG